MQPHIHCSHRHTQDSCNFLPRQLPHMKQVQNVSLKGSQSIKCLIKQDTDLLSRALRQ